MLQPLDVEHCLASLSRSIPTLQWWRFKLSKPDNRKHVWISLPADVEVVCGKTSLLPKNSRLLGRLHVLHWGADCLVQGIHITPSEKDQVICIETRASDRDPRIFWIDVNQLAVTVSANGIQEIVDTSRPTQPLLGSHIWGWLSGLQIFCSQPQSITERCFLIPVDFSSRDDIAVLLSHNTKSDRVAVCKPASPSQKLIVVNPRTNELYSCHLDSTSSPFENAGMKVKKKEEVAEDEEENEELAFPASMMDEEATKRDTKLSETLVEIEDFLCRVIWTIQHPSDGCVGRDTNVEAQRCRIAMQLDEMQSCEEEDLKIHESNASLSLLEKLLGILTSLLEIGEMVNMHRRRDESCVLRLVDQKLPELTSWVDKSQLEESNVPLPQARQTLNQLACIQSAMQIFVGKAKPTTNLEAMIAKVKFCVGESLKNEIQEKLEEDAPSHEVSLKAGDIMTAFADSMRKYLSFLPTSVVWQLEKPSNPIQTLQHIKSSLVKNMAILKECCGWIPCILSEGIQQSLSIPQELLTDLKTIHDHAFTVYKQLEMYISLVCEHSGLYTLAVRLTNILERSTDEKLSQWQLSQMEQELDRCEAECAVEILSSGKENHAFVKMVARSLLEHTSVARNVTDDVPTIQEPRLSELLERLKSLTSTSNLSSPSAFFEALLIGWYLQSRSTIDSQVDELVCRLEQEVSVTLQDTLLLHLRISEMEEFLSQMSPIFTPYDAEASSLRDALLILSDVILRLNSAVQLLERMAFLTNLHLSQRLETLRFAYPGVLEGLTRCFRALKALLRELSEWRKCIVLVDDSDQYDTATQAVIEVVNFAINTITQDLQNVTGIKFFNVPDFLSEILEWLISFRSSLLGFRKMSCQYRLEKSVNYSHSSALLHDLLNLEWLLAESRLQSQRDLAHEIGGTAAGDLKTSWMASIQKILEDIEPTKRRRSLNLLEGMERSSREQRQSLLKLLMGSWETVESFEGVTLLNYIVARTEGFADLKVQLLEEKYSKTDDQSNVCEKPNSDVCKETFCTLMKNLSEEFRQLHDKQNGICDDLKIAECLRNSEILVKIGSQYVATSKCSLHLIDRVLFSYWPEALLKLIATDQSRGNKKSPADWRICALDFRNTVARRLAKGSFNIAGEGLSQVETKDVDGSLANLRMAIEEADRILHGIQDDFGMDTKDVWQACLRLHDLFQSYTSQLGRQINDLTLPSLRAVKKDLQSLDSRIKELAHGGSSPGVLEDCSQSVAHLEESLQALRQTARILFTCLATDSKLSPQVTPSKHLDVNELYKRAVKLVNDYEASEIGCQILEAWQRLQSIADKLGRLQAGLPLTESFSNYEALTAHSPIASTSDIHLDGFSSASMARKRSWSLLEILGSHECLYPGCRGKKRDKHESHIADDGLLHDLHGFYSLLCSEFHDRAMRIPVEVLTSNTQKAASSEVALMNLRQEWHRDMGLVNQFNNLQRRAKMDDSRRSEIKTSLCLIETIWGETTPPNVFFEATERLATVSSWLCEVERHLDLDVLPRLQTAWKNSTGTDTLSVVEECVYKMNEIAEDLEGLEKNGILAERHLKNVKHSLQTGWFNVREFLLNRCVGPAFHEDSTSARYFPLVDDFLRHSAELGFQDCGLKATHTRLCNQYLLHGLTQRAHHPVEGGRKFCSTNRSLRLLFLPPWLTERCRIVQHRPPIALAIHSIPDISTEIYPPLSNATELAFHSPKCAALQSRRWFSLPDIRSQSPIHQDYEVNSNFIASKDEAEVNSPEETPNEVVMKTSQLSFSALPSEDEKTEAEEEEPTISEEPRDLALMRDVQLLLAQLKSQHLPLTNDMDVNANKKNSEPNECQETEERERSTTLTPPECQVSRKLRDKSPITWCTVYLPNDEETVPSTHPETLTERGVVQIASDPLMPKCEPYTPMVFSAPHEVSDQQGGQIAEPEEALEDVEGMRECNPSITDDSGVCDWLRSQQAENIERLMKECEADDDKEDMSLTGMDDPSGASGLLESSFSRTKNSVSISFEESDFGDDGWPRRTPELPIQETNYSIFAGGTEDYSFNEAKGSQVNWGPLVERPESPHLSVISEASTDESALEKQNSIDGKLRNSPLEVYGVEGHDDYGEWKTVASKKTRSRKNGRAERRGQEEDGETKGFPYSPPESSIRPENENEHAVLTPTQTSCGVEDGLQGIQPQEGDSEEDTDKTISETQASEVRERENESAKSLHISTKSLSHPVGDFNTKEGGKEPTILEDSENSALMRDVQPLSKQLKSKRSPIAGAMDVVGSQKNSEIIESQGSEEGECNTTPTPSECQVSRKLRDKSPITWCTVYLPNDEETVPSTHPETLTERGVVQIASDPLMPKCEPYTPMVFSAPHEVSDQQGGQIAEPEEALEDVEGMRECNPSITDDSGVCDWLRSQQAENIERLMKECEADDDKEDMSLTGMDDPSGASVLLEMPFPRTKNSVSNSFEESGFGDEEWSRRSHELPTHQTSDSLFTCGVENCPVNEAKGGRVDWGPCVERLESPHLSVITEDSTNNSTLERHQYIDDNVLKSSQEISEAEGLDNSSGFITVAPKKTRSRKNRDVKKKCEEVEEEEGTRKFPFSPPEIATFWNGGNKHDALTPTPTGLVVKDESQRTKLQEGDLEEENGKTISEVESFEVRTKEDESAEPLRITMKSSTDSVDGTDAEEEQFQGEIREHRRELTEDNDMEGLGAEISAVEKRSSQTIEDARNASEVESQVPGGDGILETTALLEAENDNFLEPRCEPRIALVQRDTERVHKQVDRKVKIKGAELLPRENIATREARKQASGEDLDRQSGKVSAMEKIDKSIARNSAKIKKKMKNSQQKKWSKDQLARAASASDGKTDSRSTVDQEFQVLDNHGKDENLLNRFQSAAKFERGGSTKPNGKNKKYQALKNGRGVNEFDDLSNVKGHGNNSSGAYVKCTREAHKKVKKEPTSNYLQDNLFHSIFAGVVEDGFNSEFIYNGLSEYVPRSDDEAKQETEGVKIAKVMKDTKGTGSCLQKKGEDGKTSGSLFEGAYPVYVNEPFAVWNGNQWNPAVPNSEFDHCEMDQQNASEDLELNNKEVLLTSLHLDGLWEAEAKQAILNEANSTKGSGKEEAVWDQVVESTVAIQSSNDFSSTLKEYTCQDPGQSVCVTSNVDENGSQPEDMSSIKKNERKNKRCRSKRDFGREAGNKEVAPSAHREINEKAQFGNEAVSIATEFRPRVGEGGLDKKSNNQLDLPDLDEGSPSNPKENSNSAVRKSGTEGDEEEKNGKEKVDLDEPRKPNELEETDATEGFLPSEEFETYAGEDGKEGVSHELHPQRGRGTLKEYLKEGEESRKHAAEGCDTSDEIDQSSPKASEPRFMKSGKRKHRNRRHLMCEGEVEERNSCVVSDSQEVSSIEATVNLKTSKEIADVGYPLQSEESKGELGFVRDGQEPEVEKQTSNELKEVTQPVECDILINGLTTQPQDEPQINERESEDVGGTLHEVVEFGEANAAEHLHETISWSSEQEEEEEEVEERLQNGSDVEGVGAELSPLTNDDVLRGGTKGDAEHHERPAEGRITLDEIDQFKSLQEVADLSCAGELGQPSMKDGKRKRHRKGRNLTSEVKVGGRPGSTVFASQKAATTEAEVEVKASVVTADVRYPMQSEKVEDTLEIVDSDQELVSELEKQSTIVLDKVSQSAEHEVVVNESAGETEDEPQINECELKVQGDSVIALRTSGKVSDVEHLHELKVHSLKHEDRGEEVGRLQNEGYAEGADGDLQPQINKDFLREYTREDTVSQEDPAEFDQSEATPRVVALPSLKVPEAPSAKGGKRNKKHRKARHLPVEAKTQGLDSSAPLPEKVMTGISDEAEFHPSKTVVDEQETALDLLKETSQPLQHENLLNDSSEHLKDWPRISNHKLEVRDVEAIGDELQPQTNEETLKNSTVEIVESEGSQIFSVLSESEGVPVRSESKKRHRKGKHTRGEGEIKTPKTNADTGYSIESKEGAKAKDTATGDVALVSDALGEISLPNEEELMEEEMTGHLQCETQSSNCKLEGQAMIVDDSKPHSAEEDTKKWDHEESEDESKPQKTGDISRECTDEGDAESYKHSTEGGCNVNEVVESEANQDVDVSSSSHEPEAPLVKRMKKKKHRKRKQLLHEALVVLGVELPLQPGKDGTALDVATDDQKTVPGIDKHSTVALEEVAVKGSFSYLKGEPQINECELEVHGDLVHEFKGTGDANRTVHLNESKLHPLEHAKNQMHREEEECGHRSDGSEFEGAGDNLQVQTSNEVLKEIAGEREESYEYPTEVEDNGDEVVGAEARQTTDALSTLQEPEGISIKTEERNQHREDGCLHDEADAQNLKVPTAPLSKEVLSMNNEDEVKPAKTSDDEHECVFGPMKEIFRSKEHEAVVNESFGPVNSELQTSECTMGVQGESVPESRSPVKAGGPKPQTMKQREEEQLQEESDIEGVRDEPQFQKSNDVVSADVKEASEHQVCSAEGRDTLNELDQSEAVRRAVDLPSVEGFEALSTKGRKKKKQKKRRHIMDEIEVDDIPASTVLASSKISSMEADADLKTSEIPTDMGCPMQPEEAEGILDIAGDDNESVPEIGKQFTVILDEVPQPVEHEFVVNELTDQPEDESQTNECESEVVGETRNEYMGFGKINVVEQLHEIRARSSEQDEGVEEHLQDESDVEGGDVELGPAASNDVIEGGTEGDAEPQEHPAESSITLAEIGRSETPQKVVDSLSAEEPEAPFIKGGKRKKHRKGRHLTGEAMVEDRLASTVPDSQGSCSMEAEVVLRSPEVTADVGLPMQPEEVKDTLDIVDDEQELVPEFEKQPTIVFDEVSQSVQHEFLFNESSDQPEDELQINECESEVADEALNERTGLGKGNVGEQLHATRAQSSEREEGVEEHLQDVSGAEGVGIDLPPQTTENGFREGKKEQAQPEAIPAKGNDILDKIDQSETAHGSVGLPSLEIPEVPPIKDGKKKKQRKRRHIMGEAEFGGRPTSAVLAVDDQESVSEIEKQANNAIEEAPQPTPHDFVVNDLTDHLDDWFTTKECDTEVQEASADEFGTICKANAVICSYETEARSSEYENTGIEEHMQDEVDVEGVSKESQHHTGKDSLEEYTKADSESQENTAEGRVIPDEIDQSEALQKIVDTSSAEEVEAPSMKGRKKKHRKGRNLRGEAEVEYRPASQETFSMDDAANFKTSEKAADVRCPMQPEEDKSPPNVAVGDEKSASSTLEEISQSNKQELMEKELPSHLEGGTQPVPFELEIPGSTGDESRTIFQFNDLVPFRETDKQFDKRNKKPSHCGAEGKFWHDGLCLEGVVNATQPHTDDEDLDGSLDETAGSQEHSKEGENTVGETVECEAILSDGSSPSLRKLESPSTNRVKATEIEKEQYQKGNSASLLEEQLLQSSFDGVNTFRDVMPQGEPSPELSEIGEIWVTKEVDSTFKNRPTSDESFSSYPKYKDSLELEDTESLRNPALECDGHLSIPQIRLDIQEEFDLTESVESRGSSKEHVESGAGASQAKLVVEEVPSNQEKEKPGRMESTNDYSGDEKLPNLWVPILLPLSKARETVEGKEPELSRSSNDRFTLHAPDLEKLAGERSQISDFATSDDLAVTLESTHSPDASSSPKIDDSLPLSRDSSPNSDEDLFQADSAMEIGEGIADTESKSTQEQVSLSPDISKPPSQKSKENSKKQGKKKKQQKEKTLECRRPIQVVDAGMDERRSPEQLNETMPSPSPEESDAGSTKLENKKKKQQKRKCAKNAHRTEENSKFLPFVVETEKYPIDKAVREAECVQITSTSPTSKEASESSSEQVYESNVQGISSDFEGRSPVIVVKMEFQKESIPGSDVERTTGDEKESGQEGDNLECNSEQIESWKEAERLKYPAATTQETVDPNRTVNVQIHGNMKESMHRAKELDENAEAQRKDEEEPGVNEFPEFVCQEYIDVDGDKGEYDQLSKEADTLVGNMEGKDGSNLEESHGIEEMGPCQILREFGRIPTGMDSKGLADEHFRSDEKEVMNRVKGISDKDMKSTSQPSKGADGSEASLDHFVLPKPPGSEVQRNESHQGTWYTILDDPIPAPVGLENENLQKTESFKVGRKDGAEKESSESAPPHLNKATRDGNSVVVAEEEGTTGEESPPHDEHLGQTGSVHETESDMIGTDLPFSQESDNEVAELERSKKKHWKKGSTMNETVECLTPALEVDKPHESVGPVDETNIPTDAIESKVVDMDDDLLKKDMPQQEVEKPKNVECSQRVDIQDVGATSREPDSVGKVQGAITDVKIEEAFSSKSGKKRRKKEKTEKADYPSATSPPEMSYPSKSRQRWPINLQEVEKGDRDVATDSQQSLSVEAPVEDVQPDITSTPREGDILSSGSLTETTQPSDVATSLHPPSPLKADVEKEPCIVADVEIGRQIEIENVEVDEEEADEGAVTSTDHSFAFLEQSPSDTDEVDDFTVVVKAPPPRTIIEAEAPAEPVIIKPSKLQIRVKPRRWPWPGSFLILLLFLLFFLIPIIILFCIAAPDFCFLPGACPGLTLRQRINAYINDYHRQRMSPFPT